MTRSQAREIAFFIVFEHSFSNYSVDEIIDNSAVARDIDVPDFSRELAKNVIQHAEELDITIARFAKGWSVDRISKVSHAVLSIAAYEITYSEDVPCSVAINEAVNLCKIYAGEEDYSFVNGILGSIAREMGKDEGKTTTK